MKEEDRKYDLAWSDIIPGSLFVREGDAEQFLIIHIIKNEAWGICDGKFMLFACMSNFESGPFDVRKYYVKVK